MRDRTIEFVKMSAGGNDFVMVDNRKNIVNGSDSSFSDSVRKICHRKFGVGADGVILLENSQKADFKMRYFNADGGEVSMCGNGARCISRFARQLDIVKENKGNFETLAGIIHFELKAKPVNSVRSNPALSGCRPDLSGRTSNRVKILLSEPKDVRIDFPLKVEKREFKVSFINTGVPHVVVFVSDIEKVDVEKIGRMIRYHREFSPGGTNVDFVYVRGRSNLTVRTYERGVEGETLACGTGVAASAIISGLKNLVDSPVKCLTRGGDVLSVNYVKNSDDHISPVSAVYLEGPVKVAFTGKIEIRR